MHGCIGRRTLPGYGRNAGRGFIKEIKKTAVNEQRFFFDCLLILVNSFVVFREGTVSFFIHRNLAVLTVTDIDGYKGSITKSIDAEGNEPPGAPLISGPSTGSPGRSYTYAFVSSDPDGDDLYYNILWGDGTFEDWFGPNESDRIVSVNHTWAKRGTYTITARARDIYGSTGEWATLKIRMPRNKLVTNSFILRFYEFLEHILYRFPLLKFLLLRIIGLN